MPRRVLRKALSGFAGRHWIMALAAAKCFTTGLVLVALPVKLDRLGWSDSWLGLLWCANALSYTACCTLYSFALHRVPLRRAMALSCVLAALTVGYVVGGQMEALVEGLCFYVVAGTSVALACIIPFAHIRGKQERSGTRVPHPAAQALLVGDVIERQLAEMDGLSADELVSRRYDRFRRLGVFEVE